MNVSQNKMERTVFENEKQIGYGSVGFRIGVCGL
jgi:hypothetical protein